MAIDPSVSTDSQRQTAEGADEHVAVHLNSQVDINYWCQILSVNHEQLRVAVQHVGPRVAAVRRYLAGD